MGRPTVLVPLFAALVAALPLAGLWAAGRPLSPYLSFPPLTRHVPHAPFSWGVFAAYAVFEAAVAFVLIAAARPVRRRSRPRRPAGRFPWWGWTGVAVTVLFWVLAWNRFPWFAPLQRHTFVPLWLGYILSVNALCRRRDGSCPMTERPRFFLALFPASAAFWWVFEYLNRFVQNWWYTEARYGPVAYTVLATLSFSTVLPAVLSTRRWILGAEGFRRRFHGLAPLAGPAPRRTGALLSAAAGAGLALVGCFPDLLFPLVWLAPLLLLTGLQLMAGRPHVFSEMAAGDWRPAASAALAALVCGFFWEMWNLHSMAKWFYSIPYVDRFPLFEMPLLGYMGYLPFGLECLAVSRLMAPEAEG
jgi:hypothetical protein